MNILSIDTSADDTSAAVTNGRRVISNIVSSQIPLHQKYGGIMPSVAKRAHAERIDEVVNQALDKANITIDNIDYFAVTYAPGLVIALEVGIKKAKQLAIKYNKKLIPVNHLEGHIYSCFGQNTDGEPNNRIKFPYLAVIISGGHTELVILRNHIQYELLGETLDDALGEALDKSARLLTGAGYPGGPIIERLAQKGDASFHKFPLPMRTKKDLNFSYSGLKTSMMYYLKSISEKERLAHLSDISASYQQACFNHLLQKLEIAIKQIGINSLLVGGGVVANQLIRKQITELVNKYKGTVLYPPDKKLIGDNAGMIGIAGYYKAKKGIFVTDFDKFDRIGRENLDKIDS